MNRRHLTHLAIIFTVSLVIRGILFHDIGVFGDFGYWAYDTRMITRGQRPFIDFPGRSPLMLGVLTLARDAFGMEPWVLRATVIALWHIAAIPVYVITRKITDHTSAVAAIAAFLLLPFPVVYGMYVNSQALGAVLALTGLAVLVAYPRRRLSYAIAGGLVGAAFLSRRTTVVYLAVIAVWGIYHAYQNTTSDGVPTPSDAAVMLRWLLPWGTASALAFTTVLYLGYLVVAGFNPATGWALFELDAIGLIYSGGRGAYPMLGVTAPSVDVTIEGNIPVLNALCPACGAWAARRGLKMLLLAGPVAIPLLWYARGFVDYVFTQRDRHYLVGALAPLAAYGVYAALQHGFPYRAAYIVAFVAGAIAVWHTTDPPYEVLKRPGVALIAVLYAVVVTGYLVRERRLIVYYMMDAWPAIAILTGIVLVAWYRHTTDRRVWTVVTLAAAAMIIIAAATSVPLAHVALTAGNGEWFTLAIIGGYSADLNNRVHPGDTVYSPHPAYVTGSDARLYRDDSRAYMTLMLYDNTTPSRWYIQNATHDMKNGRIEYVVLDRRTRDTFQRHPELQRVFTECYQRARGPQPYHATSAALYRYKGC